MNTTHTLSNSEQATVFAIIDMRMVVESADYLLATHDSGCRLGSWRARRTLEAGMVVSYARPFTQSRLHKLEPVATGKLRETHDALILQRNKTYAHTDSTPLRVITPVASVTVSSSPLVYALTETWHPPTPEFLRSVVDVAEFNISEFISTLPQELRFLQSHSGDARSVLTRLGLTEAEVDIAVATWGTARRGKEGWLLEPLPEELAEHGLTPARGAEIERIITENSDARDAIGALIAARYRGENEALRPPDDNDGDC